MARKSPKRKKGKKKVRHPKFRFPKLGAVRSLMVLLGLLLSSMGLYWISMDNDFILDDKIVITENIYTQKGLGGISDHLSTESFQGYFKGERKDLLVGGRYRPLSLIAFSVIYEIAGDQPNLYHWVNVISYALVSFLVFFITHALLSRFRAQQWMQTSIPLMAAFLFLFHPIHIEAVANIKGLDEILTMGLALLSWVFALKAYNSGKYFWAPVLGLTFFLGLLAKENALTFLAVIPLSIYLFGRYRRKHHLLVMLPLLVAAIAYLLLRYQVLGFFLDPGKEVTDIMNNPFYGLSTAEHYATILFTWLKYLGLLLFPHPLVHDYYPYAIPIMDFSNPVVYISLLVHLGLIAYGFWAAFVKKHFAGFSILYYFITFSIVSNFLFTVGTFMNERFLFMPSLGFVLLLSLGIAKAGHLWVPARFSKGFLVAVCALILAGYSWKTYDRLPDWSSYVALNSSAVEHYPTSARSTLFMGTALFNEAKEVQDREEKLEVLKSAEYWIDQSLAVFPNYGNEQTRNFKYYNAYKMKAGTAAEIYKLNGDLDYLLDVFVYVGKDKPHIQYLMTFLDYLHRRNANRSKMEAFYHRLGYEELAQNKKNLRFANAFISKGLEHLPNSATLNRDKGQILQMAGRDQEAQTYLQRARSQGAGNE